MRKKKSACCVRNDGWRVGRGMRRPRVIARERGSSCAESELWNNLTAPRPFASSGFSLGSGMGCGERWEPKEEEATSGTAAIHLTQPGQELRVVRRRARESNGILLRELRRVEMRNWCAALVMGGLLALPLCAQQKSSGAGHETTNAANREKSATSNNGAVGGSAAANSIVTASKGVFALPATPRPTPFPGRAADSKDTRAPGTLVPRFELGGMYHFINFAPGDPFQNFSNQGGAGVFTYNASRWVGLTAEAGTYSSKRNIFPLTGNNNQVDGGIITYLFGPRLNLRKFDYFVPFGEILVGGARGNGQITGSVEQDAFAMAAGGGVDMVLTKNLAWRVVQLDYLMTTFSGNALGATARQNNFRAGTGLVLRFGIPNPPPPPNHPPVAACSGNPTSVYAGSGDSVAVHVTP